MKRILFVSIFALLALSIAVLFQRYPSSSSENTPTPLSSQKQSISIYLIAVGDDGKKGPKIGCGDSVVEVKKEISETKEILRASLSELLSLHDTTYEEGKLYNAIAASSLSIEKIVIQNGVADIYLTGSLSLGGVCDSPRVEEQLKATALQFPSIKTANFYLNGIPLNEVLSGK